MMKSFDLATGDRRELLLDKDRLHTIGLQFQPSWATGNGLRDMQTPPKAPAAEHAKPAAEQAKPETKAAKPEVSTAKPEAKTAKPEAPTE